MSTVYCVCVERDDRTDIVSIWSELEIAEREAFRLNSGWTSAGVLEYELDKGTNPSLASMVR